MVITNVTTYLVTLLMFLKNFQSRMFCLHYKCLQGYKESQGKSVMKGTYKTGLYLYQINPCKIYREWLWGTGKYCILYREKFTLYLGENKWLLIENFSITVRRRGTRPQGARTPQIHGFEVGPIMKPSYTVFELHGFSKYIH